LAAEAGEVDGGCWAWGSLRSTREKGVDSGLGDGVLQINAKKASHIPKVPKAVDYAKKTQAKQTLDSGIHASSAILRAYALPPGVPKERLTTLRDAFMATMKDKDFVAEISKANLELNPLSGAEVENIVRKLYQVDANLAGKLKEILVTK